jgi:hypothetical protein
MTHSGGTKFYQIFEFRPLSGGVPVTLVHYGSITNRTSTFARPVNGGQTKVSRGAMGESKRLAKEVRGYVTRDTVRVDEPSDAFWWRETFGADLAHEVDVAMFGESMGAERDPSDDPDNEVIAETTAPAITERPASWGVW